MTGERGPEVFVYGTLMPGHLRWPLLRDGVERARPGTTRGTLYDTGWGYPAACFDEPGRVEGWLLTLRPDRHERIMALLDHVEGASYQRVTIKVITAEASDGCDAFAYQWIDRRDELIALSGRWGLAGER